ncbi:Hypp6301 [Branchiostoma lanceolatum]|uniref:Hypp6301 protein n=1 Tax=Branchiostoma lanceolatum TaxID=7740 RepID=A0A8J9YSU6_BRALA|nr:Hypp6301 [Branchiostoma lanceolatum]
MTTEQCLFSAMSICSVLGHRDADGHGTGQALARYLRGRRGLREGTRETDQDRQALVS